MDGDLWAYYVGYVKEVWERMLKFTDLTLSMEIQSLQNEYVLRGLALVHLQALIEIAQYYYQWKNSDLEEEPMYVSRFRVEMPVLPFQSIPSGGFHVVQFTVEDFDLLDEYDPTTYRFTPKEEGYYLLIASGYMPGLGAGDNFQVGLYLNGPTVLTNNRQRADGVFNAYAHTSSLEHLTPTDYVQVKVNQNSGGPLNLGNARYGTYFCMQRVG